MRNTNNTGAGSLRDAIDRANAASDADTVFFSLPIITIPNFQPLTELPAITQPMNLDATSMPFFVGYPKVFLDGTSAGAERAVSELAPTIPRCEDSPSATSMARPSKSSATTIAFSPTSSARTSADPATPNSIGVQVLGGIGNYIGTDGDGINDSIEYNVISANVEGVILDGATTTGTTLAHNFIGVAADGIRHGQYQSRRLDSGRVARQFNRPTNF